MTDSKVLSLLDMFNMSETPDNIICASACYYRNYKKIDITFVTDDINCKNIARKIFHLNVESVNDINRNNYYGYKTVKLSDGELAYFYEHTTENIYDLNINEYLILNNSIGEYIDAYKWNGFEHEYVKQKNFKSMLGTFKPNDPIQKCAIDSIVNNDITVLYGKAGTGKTTLPLNFLLDAIENGKIKKCYFVYSYEPLRGARELGYEKGDHITKLLYTASIGNILASKFGDMVGVERLIEDGVIDIIPTANIRGVEFESDSMVFVTEAQNLNTYTLKTIVQRCKAGCKQIYEGDIIEQTDKDLQSIGLNRMIEVFKNHNCFGCVKLKNNYRNEVSNLADLM